MRIQVMTSRLAVLTLLLVVASRSGVPGQNAPPAGGNLPKRVDELFQKMDNPSSPGCALSVMKDGRILYEHGYGMADLDHSVPITPTTVFHVASMSKQFTAASILLLAQEGKLSLDDPVRKYIPELPDFGTPITIRQLIHHTSGLRDQWDLLGLAGWRYSLDLITDDDVLSVISRQKDLNFAPGSKHLYSNTGLYAAGPDCEAGERAVVPGVHHGADFRAADDEEHPFPRRSRRDRQANGLRV